MRAASISALLLAVASTSPVVENGRWQTLDTPHFRILSEARPSDTKKAAHRLEALRATIDRLSGGKLTQPEDPVEVYLFRGPKSFERYRGEILGGKEIDGFFTGSGSHSFTAVNLGTPGDPFAAIYHEYLHVVTFRNFPEAPLWFHEGIAELYSTFWAQDVKAEIGRPIRDHIERLKGTGQMPLATVLRVTPNSPEYNEDDRNGGFYSTSWLLVHHLYLGGEERRAALADYLDRVDQGAPPDDAFRAAFGKSPDEFDRDLSQYARGRQMPYLSLEFRDLTIPEIGDPVPAPLAEATARLGMLAAVTAKKDFSFAEAHFQALAAASPEDPRAQSGIGFVRTRQDKPEEAAAAFDRALALAEEDPRTLTLAGANLLQLLSERTGGRLEGDEVPPEALRAREYLSRALAARENDALVLAFLGQTYLFEPVERTKAGVAALEKARRLAPRNPEIVLSLAQLRARRGDDEAAHDLVENHLARIAGEEMLAEGRRLVLLAGFERARTMANSGDTAGGLAAMRELRARTDDPEIAAILDRSIESLDRNLRMNRDIDAFNKAVEDVNAGRKAKALEAFRKLAREAEDPELRKSAAEAVKKLGG